MSELDRKQLETLEKLCHIRLSKEMEEKLLSNLKDILSYVNKLSEINTDGVEPCSHVISDIQAPLAEDDPIRLLPREEFLRNAVHVGGMVKVPPIMKDEI